MDPNRRTQPNPSSQPQGYLDVHANQRQPQAQYQPRTQYQPQPQYYAPQPNQYQQVGIRNQQPQESLSQNKAFLSQNIMAHSLAHQQKVNPTNVKKPDFTFKEKYELFMNKHKKKVLIGGAILLALILSITTITILLSKQAEKTETVAETNEYVEQYSNANRRSLDEVKSQLNSKFVEQGALMAIQAYEEEIATAETDEEKAELHSERAQALHDWLLATGEDYRILILEDAYAAEELAPTWKTAYDIYRFESGLGSIDKAQEYAKIANERNPDLAEIKITDGAG